MSYTTSEVVHTCDQMAAAQTVRGIVVERTISWSAYDSGVAVVGNPAPSGITGRVLIRHCPWCGVKLSPMFEVDMRAVAG